MGYHVTLFKIFVNNSPCEINVSQLDYRADWYVKDIFGLLLNDPSTSRLLGPTLDVDAF